MFCFFDLVIFKCGLVSDNLYWLDSYLLFKWMLIKLGFVIFSLLVILLSFIVLIIFFVILCGFCLSCLVSVIVLLNWYLLNLGWVLCEIGIGVFFMFIFCRVLVKWLINSVCIFIIYCVFV